MICQRDSIKTPYLQEGLSNLFEFPRNQLIDKLASLTDTVVDVTGSHRTVNS